MPTVSLLATGVTRAAGWDLPAEELTWYSQLHAARILIDATTHDDADGHPYAVLTGPARDLLAKQ